jgi:hypothetical protein
MKTRQRRDRQGAFGVYFELGSRLFRKAAVDTPLTRVAGVPCSAGDLVAGSFHADSRRVSGIHPTHPLGEARHSWKPRPALVLRPTLAAV